MMPPNTSLGEFLEVICLLVCRVLNLVFSFLVFFPLYQFSLILFKTLFLLCSSTKCPYNRPPRRAYTFSYHSLRQVPAVRSQAAHSGPHRMASADLAHYARRH